MYNDVATASRCPPLPLSTPPWPLRVLPILPAVIVYCLDVVSIGTLLRCLSQQTALQMGTAGRAGAAVAEHMAWHDVLVSQPAANLQGLCTWHAATLCCQN